MAPLDPILAALLSVPPDPNAIPISAQPIETVRAETDRARRHDQPGPAMRRVEETVP
jgi:hypothetical protein